MKDLPYFLSLIKKNIILWTIISTNSFSKVDFGKTQHDFLGSQALILRNYSLSKDDQFKEIWIMVDQFGTSITFRDMSSKYPQNSKYYFGTNKKMLVPVILNFDKDVSLLVDSSKISVGYYRKGYFTKFKQKMDSLEKAVGGATEKD